MSKPRYIAVNREQAAREYWKRNIVFFGVFIGGFLAIVIFGPLITRVFGRNGGWVGLLWMIAFVIAGAWRMSWPCPSCGKKFFYKWWYGNAFAMKCVHCGFRP